MDLAQSAEAPRIAAQNKFSRARAPESLPKTPTQNRPTKGADPAF
jgi:hypothetical protein